MSQSRELSPRKQANLIPYDPTDDIVYERRYTIIRSVVQALEDENNLIAWKISQIQARLERRKAEIPPQVKRFGLPLSPTLLESAVLSGGGGGVQENNGAVNGEGKLEGAIPARAKAKKAGGKSRSKKVKEEIAPLPPSSPPPEHDIEMDEPRPDDEDELMDDY